MTMVTGLIEKITGLTEIITVCIDDTEKKAAVNAVIIGVFHRLINDRFLYIFILSLSIGYCFFCIKSHRD